MPENTDVTDSILNSTKKALGIAPEYDVFDPEIIVHINSCFATLHQLGVGPSRAYMIYDDTSVWDEFIGSDDRLNSVRSYIYVKVRLIFDPPTTSFAIESFNKMAQELEWRLNIAGENNE